MYKVYINFKEASSAWLRNKKKLGQGMYKYVCGAKKRSLGGSLYCRNNPGINGRRCRHHL